MNEKLYQICDEIEKIKEFQDVVKSKFTKLELTNTTPVKPVELNTFNEVDMTPQSLNDNIESEIPREEAHTIK